MLADPKGTTARHGRDRDDARHPAAAYGARGSDQLALLLPPPEDAHSSEDDQRREWIADPVKTLEQKHAAGDQTRTHEQGAKYAPVEDPTLLLRWDPEVG